MAHETLTTEELRVVVGDEVACSEHEGVARIEGVAEWKIFWYVIMPLVRPAIAALAVLIFTFVWNDFFWANVLTQGEAAKPITAGVRALNGQFVNNWHLVSAASLMAAIPPVLMFFLMQKHFIAGLTLGAVK